MADEERTEEEETSSEEGTQPGDWERKPADEEDLRHDDSEEPLAEPLGDDADDDQAEQEVGDVTTGDEGFDRPDPPDEKEVGDTGRRLEEEAAPLLEGPEVVGVPTRSLAGIAAFVVVFCIAFFALWALLGGIGILLGMIVGAALGLGAMKLIADRAG